MWTARNLFASSTYGRFSASDRSFHSAPSRFDISELCIFGFSCAIRRRRSLLQTINAFMGRLTRSGLHLPLLSPFAFEPVFGDGARIVVVDMANRTRQIQIKLPSSWRALNFPRQNSDGLSRVRLSFCRGTLSKPRYTLMKTTRYFWLSPPRSHVLLIGRKRASTDWPISAQPMTLLINEPLVALLMSSRLTGRQPMWQAVGALVKRGGIRRFDSEIWPACRQIS